MRHLYTRYQLSNALDRGDLPTALSRGHAARCASCRAYAARLQSLHASLQVGAASAPVPLAAAARRPRSSFLVAAPLVLGVAAAIALWPSRSSTPVGAGPRLAATPVPHLRAVTDRVSAMLARSDAPLEAELVNLIDDGRRGLDVVLASGGLRRQMVERMK